MLKLCKTFFLYKTKTLTTFNCVVLIILPLANAPLPGPHNFFFQILNRSGGAPPPCPPPPGYASAVYLSETGKVQKNMYKNKNN